ncbi:hypothetical protein D9613_009514 [Agrocybe pediades]|uniref:Uncharacterized protein n=1 Tax=Agrocybe pediades TaxID=84607 RepID=A0A8H4R4N6_9AGAR|nr:hypothetical protein D9613_009514 [Agrocybe pediades]
MGLGEMSESEMVEYLMMLSLEEAERREAERQEAAFLQDQVHTEEEGVFEPDSEEDSEAYEGRFTAEWEDDDRAWSSASSSEYASVSSSVTSTLTRQARVGISIAGASTASSSASRNTGIAASPGISSYWANPNAGVDIHAEEFPPIPGSADGSPTSNRGSAMASTSRSVAISDLQARPVVQASPPKGPTPSSSPKSLKGSAWSMPLKAKLSQPTIQKSASSSSAASTTASTSMIAAAASSSSARSVGGGVAAAGNLADEEMDEDLRFALELSLVEARSRGEDV